MEQPPAQDGAPRDWTARGSTADSRAVSGPQSAQRTLRAFVKTIASHTESKDTFEMSTFLSSLPEKFSAALQPETLLDLLQIEGMKIEEESEVR